MANENTMDEAIQTRLVAQVALATPRIYLSFAHQELTKPYIVYQSEEAEAISTMQDDGKLRAETYTITSFGDSMTSAKAVSAQADAALRRYKATVGNIVVQDIFIEPDTFDEFDIDSRVFSVTFRAKAWYLLP